MPAAPRVQHMNKGGPRQWCTSRVYLAQSAFNRNTIIRQPRPRSALEYRPKELGPSRPSQDSQPSLGSPMTDSEKLPPSMPAGEPSERSPSPTQSVPVATPALGADALRTAERPSAGEDRVWSRKKPKNSGPVKRDGSFAEQSPPLRSDQPPTPQGNAGDPLVAPQTQKIASYPPRRKDGKMNTRKQKQASAASKRTQPPPRGGGLAPGVQSTPPATHPPATSLPPVGPPTGESAGYAHDSSRPNEATPPQPNSQCIAEGSTHSPTATPEPRSVPSVPLVPTKIPQDSSSPTEQAVATIASEAHEPTTTAGLDAAESKTLAPGLEPKETYSAQQPTTPSAVPLVSSSNTSRGHRQPRNDHHSRIGHSTPMRGVKDVLPNGMPNRPQMPRQQQLDRFYASQRNMGFGVFPGQTQPLVVGRAHAPGMVYSNMPPLLPVGGMPLQQGFLPTRTPAKGPAARNKPQKRRAEGSVPPAEPAVPMAGESKPQRTQRRQQEKQKHRTKQGSTATTSSVFTTTAIATISTTISTAKPDEQPSTTTSPPQAVHSSQPTANRAEGAPRRKQARGQRGYVPKQQGAMRGQPANSTGMMWRRTAKPVPAHVEQQQSGQQKESQEAGQLV